MRKAERLFKLVHELRKRRVTTAARLAKDLSVSERTVYRDIAALARSGVPVEGEPGVGYALQRGFELPPLTFTADELEALVLGARMVTGHGDAALGAAAQEALAKIELVLPPRMRGARERVPVHVPDFHLRRETRALVGTLRIAVRERRRVRFGYADATGQRTARTVVPLGLLFWGSVWSLAAWCELRAAFRNFRLDRIKALALLDLAPETPGRTLADYMTEMAAYRDEAARQRSAPPAASGDDQRRERS
jgi:predicted DNA-binding transcriptional regulator YafY